MPEARRVSIAWVTALTVAGMAILSIVGPNMMSTDHGSQANSHKLLETVPNEEVTFMALALLVHVIVKTVIGVIMGAVIGTLAANITNIVNYILNNM